MNDRRQEAIQALAEACKSFGIPPFAMIGYKAPMFPDYPLTEELLPEVRACLYDNVRRRK